MSEYGSQDIEKIALEAIKIAGLPPAEIERSCWTAVHIFFHGFPPSEYDIREIDEELYLSVLRIVRNRLEL